MGWYLGRKLLSPLGQLTKEAVRAEGLIQNGKIYTEEILKGHWPENEIGELERSFKALVSKLKVLAMKERAFQFSDFVFRPVPFKDFFRDVCSSDQIGRASWRERV